jgi:phosphoribosylformylglycinamidine cyclo-ligase
MSHHVEEDEMYRTFNMGVGMVLVVDPKNLQDVLDGCDGYVIGEVVKGDGSVVMQ